MLAGRARRREPLDHLISAEPRRDGLARLCEDAGGAPAGTGGAPVLPVLPKAGDSRYSSMSNWRMSAQSLALARDSMAWRSLAATMSQVTPG